MLQLVLQNQYLRLLTITSFPLNQAGIFSCSHFSPSALLPPRERPWGGRGVISVWSLSFPSLLHPRPQSVTISNFTASFGLCHQILCPWCLPLGFLLHCPEIHCLASFLRGCLNGYIFWTLIFLKGFLFCSHTSVMCSPGHRSLSSKWCSPRTLKAMVHCLPEPTFAKETLPLLKATAPTALPGPSRRSKPEARRGVPTPPPRATATS